MRYLSSRGDPERKRFCDILLEGLAPDGGLYLPEHYPQVDVATLGRWREQFAALLHKNAAVLAWRWRSSLLIVLLPTLFVVGLYYLTASLSKLDTSARAFALSRCTAFDVSSLPYAPAEPCVTLAWAPSGDVPVCSSRLGGRWKWPRGCRRCRCPSRRPHTSSTCTMTRPSCVATRLALMTNLG